MDDIARIDREMAEMKAEMTEMRADIKQLLQIANIGQGVMWGLLKVGGLVIVLAGAVAWLWDKFGK